MELFSPIIAALLFCLTVVIILKKSRNPNPKPNLPPGPKPLPIIGNMHQLRGSPLLHHLLRDMAKTYGPLMHLQLGENSTVVVTSPEMAKEIYKTNDLLFASRPPRLSFRILSYNFSDMIFGPYGAHWRQLRKICTMELLSPKRVGAFRALREDEISGCIESVASQDGSVINLTRKLFTLSYSLTGRAAFGKKNEYTEKYISLLDEMNELVSGFCLADMFPSVKLIEILSPVKYKMENAQRRIDEIVKNILVEHKKKLTEEEAAAEEGSADEEAKEDLVDVLLGIQKRRDLDLQLTDTHIKAVIFDIFTAASEASATAMDWAMAEILKKSEVTKRAQEEVRNAYNEKGNVDESRLHELTYLHAIFKETLRLHPSVPLLLPRVCAEKCAVGDYEIPKGATVLVNAYAMARDPKYWVKPDEFDPDRFLTTGSSEVVDYRGNDFEYIPFGAGRRICAGISYSEPSIKLMLAQLLFHFDWKLPGGMKNEELDMSENLGLTVKRLNELQVIPSLYHRSCFRNDN